MNRRAFQSFTWLMWLALPLIALRYWQAWDRLPFRMATHFDINGRANGWMTRDVSLWFALGITAFLLVIFTAALLVIHSQKASDTASWALLVFFYFVIGFVVYGNELVVRHNLYRAPVQLGPALLLIPLAVIGLLAVFLRARRGQPLPAQQWMAEETHASPFFAMVFLFPLLLEFWILSTMPSAAVRLAVALMCIFFSVVAVFAWSGFHYYFGPAGLEIRALGFRLRSVPAAQITSYAVEGWNLLRGYGIRGVGRSRAYVWGNKVVHVRTPQGEIFLGHNEPERIMRDLDMITHHREQQVSLGSSPL
ncbi:MAG: DUF1648 domain-containing protein [Terriglobales bacterium]